MKVLFINAVCGSGSTGKIIVDLLKTLMENGHEGKIAYGVGECKGVAQKHTIKIGSSLGIKYHNLLARVTDHTGLYSKKATKKLIVEINKYKPDVIHLHNLHGYYINYEILFEYLKRANIPVIWTLHDCWSFTGHCAYFSKINCEKWKTKCEKCKQLRRYPVCYLKGDVEYNYLNKKKCFTDVRNMTIVTPSKWLGDLVRKSYLSEYSLHVIPNGIDTKIFYPTKQEFRSKNNLQTKKIILAVANAWNERKGFGDLIKLAERLDETYQLVVVGVSKKQLKEMPLNIIGIERTSSAQQLADIYSSADIFINTTYEENYPTVNLEAQACGLPVISYDTGGCSETIKNQKSILVETGNVEDLEKAIKKGVEKIAYKDIAKMGLDKSECYQQYLELYREIKGK